MTRRRDRSLPDDTSFRFEDASTLLEHHLARTSVGVRSIYLAVVALLVGVMVALPLVEVDVYVRAPGIVRPTSEKHEVSVGVDGFVESSRLTQATTVDEDEVLVTIRARPTEARIETLEADLARAESGVADLVRLLALEDGWAREAEGLATVEYAQQARELSARLAEVDLRISNELRELGLVELQLEQQVIPAVRVDEQRFEVEHAKAERALLLEGSRRQWAQDLARLREEAGALRTQREQLSQARALHEVRSPTRGSLDEILALSPGSFVRAGTRVAVVSPDAELVGEVLVSPQDVGLVRAGGPVALRIDAFNPHEWGIVGGEVASISGDALDTPGGPAFRIRTSLDRGYLELPSGHRGHLRKGMTFEARFLVARRSLFQLLRDRVDDWLTEPRAEVAL